MFYIIIVLIKTLESYRWNNEIKNFEFFIKFIRFYYNIFRVGCQVECGIGLVWLQRRRCCTMLASLREVRANAASCYAEGAGANIKRVVG